MSGFSVSSAASCATKTVGSSRLLRIASAFAIWLCLPSTSHAQDEARLAAFLKRFPAADADKDGKLTMEEVRAFNQKRRAGRGDRPGAAPARKPTHAEVKYGDHKLQAFDIWLAESKDGKAPPLCIHIHGGGFRGGDKRLSAGQAGAYLREGISFASMNYRLTEGGKYPYPIAMHDAAAGLQFIRSKAEEWNLDPERVVCYGGSAGAGISMWLAFHDDLADPDAKDPVARQSTRILAAGSMNGQSTYDMRTFREWFGVPDLEIEGALRPFYALESDEDLKSERVTKLMEDASAINHLDKDDVPVFMTYSRGDVPVDEETMSGVWVHHVRLGLKLKEAMEKVGLECVVTSPEHKDARYGNMNAFLIEKLKSGVAKGNP